MIYREAIALNPTYAQKSSNRMNGQISCPLASLLVLLFMYLFSMCNPICLFNIVLLLVSECMQLLCKSTPAMKYLLHTFLLHIQKEYSIEFCNILIKPDFPILKISGFHHGIVSSLFTFNAFFFSDLGSRQLLALLKYVWPNHWK